MGKRMHKGSDRPVVAGKFIETGHQKLYIKGVTYGTFAPDISGEQFSVLEVVAEDFKKMAESGINTVRTYTVPSVEILNLARQNDLYVMVGLPWEQHLTFLDTPGQSGIILQNIRKMVLQCRNHPAILCYCIGNEIPSAIVRYYGAQKISAFLERMFDVVKETDPGALVTYVNYPTTEYLRLPFLDFYCFNVYLETREKLSAYISRLQNLSGEKPLVLAEIGLDSRRNGTDRQAEVMEWQLQTIFEGGCAGAFVFSWTDEWWRGGASIDDWDFGLVDRSRVPKPALQSVSAVYQSHPPLPGKNLPRISVVVCSYNGSATIRDTLQACLRIDYPDYEIIVINDGSKDSTREIADEFPVKVVHTRNRGLSNARNRGIVEATGEIVAFTDDDAMPDPLWLRYLAIAYLHADFAGVGGPNIAPLNSSFFAECVSYAPGRPVQVLSSDQVAEHIPGCNMSFRRSVLLEAGGFDPVYRAAGDDVDICWRIQDLGYQIGFHPSAFVWHYCRNTLGLYWKQQQGYGKAEALLERKWPEKYNGLGHHAWKGFLYGAGLTRPLPLKKEKVYYGQKGLSLFQSVYQPGSTTVESLPLMPEWYFVILFLMVVSMLGLEWPVLFWSLPLLAFSVLIVVIQAALSASPAFANKHYSREKRAGLWLVTTFLHLVQPAARLKGRVNNGLNVFKYTFTHLAKLKELIRTPKTLTHWSETWKSGEEWLDKVKYFLEKQSNRVIPGGVFDRWDMENHSHGGVFASVRTLLTTEEHGMGKQMIKLRWRIVVSPITFSALGGFSITTYFAFKAAAFISFAIFLTVTLLLGIKVLSDTLGAIHGLVVAVRNLPVGFENEQSIATGNLLSKPEGKNFLIQEHSLTTI
jgi:O-antigen biosynthesis protein